MKKHLVLVIAFAVTAALVVPALASARTSTRLSVSLSSSYEHYDEYPTITGKLTTGTGKALKYQAVSLYYNGVKVSTKKTDAYGRARFNLLLKGRDLSASWKIRYAGGTTYSPCASVTRKTYAHIHYLAEGLAPESDPTGPTPWRLRIRLVLPGDSTYGIATSDAMVRSVHDGAETTIYTSAAAEDFSELNTPAGTSTYLIDLHRSDSDPVDVLIW